MARTFTSGNYLVSPGAVTDLTQDSTIFFRIKPSWSSGDSVSHQFFEFWTDINTRIYFVKHSDNLIYAGCAVGGGGPLNTVTDSSYFSAGVWANWRLDLSGSTAQAFLYKDNTLVGTITHSANFTPAGGMGLTLGDQASLGRPADVDCAEFAYWNRLLSASEDAVLKATGCPLHVPRGLLAYYPIIGRNSPETDLARGLTLTVTGTPAAAPHPRIFLPSSPKYGSPSSVVPPVTRTTDYQHLLAA